jgi:hypothetical protein
MWYRLCSLVVACLLTFAGVGRAGEKYPISSAKKNHWAWKAPVRPALPSAKNTTWGKNAIDAFVLAKLEAAGLEPAAAAPREQLIRRVTFDLIGLPPTPAEVDAFVHDNSPHAWDKVIDRLLASPHYGERWGRHWLDLARFAESNGYEHDEARPNAWRYRDYVIRSFNSDKPYDRFIKEHLAGDELYPADANALIATGFNLLGPDMTDASSQAQRRQNTLDDMTDTAGLVFLGLTMGCARCHDHKFEPIPQADYFRLQAFFTPAQFRSDLPVATRSERLAYEQALKNYLTLIKPVQDALTKLEEPYRKKLYEERLGKMSEEVRTAHRTPANKRSPAQKELVEKTTRLLVVSAKQVVAAMPGAERAKHKELEQQLKEFDGKKPSPLSVAMGLQEASREAPRTFRLVRGELSHPAEEVQPGWPIILTPNHHSIAAKVSPSPATSGRRTALANWIAS